MKDEDQATLKGIHVAMYAAYDDDGDIDTDRVQALARFYVGTGINGLYVGGSSGEGMLQTFEERKKVVEAVMEAVRGELRVIVHVGAAATRESVRLAEHAEHVGADAISAVPPIYYRSSEQAVETHWRKMIDSCSLPFIIYNIPQTTGFNLSLPLLQKMATYTNVIGVKMSGESTFDLQQYKANAGKSFLVFNGPDEQFLAGRMMGADGGIGGTYGLMPQLYCQLDRYFLAHRIEEAQTLQFAINDIIRRLKRYPSILGACKYILSLRGIHTGTPRLPLLPVGADDYSSLSQLNDDVNSLISRF